MDLDGSNVHMIPLIGDNNFNMSNYAWSPDSKHLAFSVPGGQYYQIHVDDADGSNEHVLSATVVDERNPFIWTSDSKSIIFSASKPIEIPDSIDRKNVFVPSYPNGLWMINADGRKLHQIL